MILINKHGRVIIVTGEEAKSMLANGSKFEFYVGQKKNRWGAIAYGQEAYAEELIQGNISDNKAFNQRTIKTMEKYGKKGEPVRDSFSLQTDEKYQEDDGLIEWETEFEPVPVPKLTREDKKEIEKEKAGQDEKVYSLEEARSIIEEEEKQEGVKIVCSKCGKDFIAPDKRHKLCNDCK